MSEPKNPVSGNEQGPPERKQTIVRGRITKINAEKVKDAPISGIELGVEFDAVKANGPNLEIWFTYHAIYKQDVGKISMSGFLMFEMDEPSVKRIADKFEKEKEFDPPLAENIVNSINYKCGTEAILPAKVLDLTAPIVPPRIGLRVIKNEKDAAAAGIPVTPAKQPSAPSKPEPSAQPPKPAPSSPFGAKVPPPFK
jgi:hypothetical protein